jgi:hypothetical protein
VARRKKKAENAIGFGETRQYVAPEPLRRYLDRIGAEVLSFRKAMVKEKSRSHIYYIERTFIQILSDGEIICSRKDHDPTEAEAEAIKEAFEGVKFPQSICCSQAQFENFIEERIKEGRSREDFFGLWDRNANGYRMIQERRAADVGGKTFHPWSRWNDGEWRNMEPDGKLPFWKPKVKNRSRVMIHEGCKAARFIDRLMNDDRLKAEKEKHPWGTELYNYEHWGMIGGALAPHRTDYIELMREAPEETIYVCDNDYPGHSALQEVSKNYKFPMKGIRFDQKFKYSFDLADEFPDEMFRGKSESRRYVGPSMRALLVPATWATELVYPQDGKGRPSTVLTRAFKEEWCHSIKPEVFIHKEWPDDVLLKTAFNNKVSPFSHVDDTARLLFKDDSSKSAVIKYNPGLPPGLYADDRGRYINTHVPADIKMEKGDVTQFLDFMDHLVTEESDRHEVLKWCATLIAMPERKMNYGLLLISEMQGVGKGTLAYILAQLMGEENTSYPSENDIVESNFNYWLTHKRLAVVHEIYAGHSSKAYNKLKTIITDPRITVSRKYMDNYEIENFIHVLACSNSKRALQLSMDDRRWLVPKVAEIKKENDYWEALHSWLVDAGGLRKLKWWAEEFIREAGPVARGADAPWSTTKGEIVEEGYSPGMQLAASVLERAMAEAKKPKEERWNKLNGSAAQAKGPRIAAIQDRIIIIDTDIIDLIKNKLYEGRQNDRLEKPMTIRKIAKSLGWTISDHKATNIPSWRINSKAGIICARPEDAKRTPGELVKAGFIPLDLKEFMEM